MTLGEPLKHPSKVTTQSVTDKFRNLLLNKIIWLALAA